MCKYDSNISSLLVQETPGSPLGGSQQTMNTSLDDHERRISHSLYGGLEGLDDNLMPRQGMMPRTIGRIDISIVRTSSLWPLVLLQLLLIIVCLL